MWDDQLFIAPTKAGRAFLKKHMTEGQPFPGAKPCFLILGDQGENSDLLAVLARISLEAIPAASAKKACPTSM